jgi:Septum formation
MSLGSAAESVSPPAANSVAVRSAYTQCAAPFRGVLARSTPLDARCITWQVNGTFFTHITGVSCQSRHNGEFVGAYAAPVGPWPSTVDKRWGLAGDGCDQLVARFVGFPSWERLDNPHIGSFHMDFNQDQWDMGDRSVRCYAAAAADDGTLVGSVKGIKTRTPKA